MCRQIFRQATQINHSNMTYYENFLCKLAKNMQARSANSFKCDLFSGYLRIQWSYYIIFKQKRLHKQYLSYTANKRGCIFATSYFENLFIVFNLKKLLVLWTQSFTKFLFNIFKTLEYYIGLISVHKMRFINLLSHWTNHHNLFLFILNC